MFQLLDNPYKACNLQLIWLIVFLNYCQKPEEEQNRLHGSAGRLIALEQHVFSSMEGHCTKAKLFGGVKVFPNRSIRIMLDKGRRLT